MDMMALQEKGAAAKATRAVVAQAAALAITSCFVIPAKAGIQSRNIVLPWMPAFAGMTRQFANRLALA